MGTRGRTSAAELTVAALATVERVQRPDAPYSLTDEQADIWRQIVARMPADWFPAETHPMLESLCCHIARKRKVEQLLTTAEGTDPFDTKNYNDLALMAERESRVVSSLMTKMRMTQQTTYDKSKKKPLQTSRPWDAD
jgi:phage gp36-like protein